MEYSNEVWNGAFSQGAWVEAQGQAEWPASSESPFTKRINWYGKRSAEVCDIWRSVFSDMPGRVVCIISSQAANSWTAQEALACPLWDQAPCAAHGINALAIAPYIGDYLGQEENLAEISSWGSSSLGLQKLFTELESGGALTGGPSGGARSQSFGWIEANKIIAERFGIALLAYEGGQHLVGVGRAASNAVHTALFTAANRDPRIGLLYTTYLQGWESRGGGLFMHYSDTGSYLRYGSWGALELVGQRSSPKYDALWSYSFGTPPPPVKDTPTPPEESPPHDNPPPTSTPSVTLSITKRGRGEVVSSPVGIACGKRCSATFSQVSQVTLMSTAASGYSFSRWRGACTHSRRRCRVSLPSNNSVTAIFARRR